MPHFPVIKFYWALTSFEGATRAYKNINVSMYLVDTFARTTTAKCSQHSQLIIESKAAWNMLTMAPGNKSRHNMVVAPPPYFRLLLLLLFPPLSSCHPLPQQVVLLLDIQLFNPSRHLTFWFALRFLDNFNVLSLGCISLYISWLCILNILNFV